MAEYLKACDFYILKPGGLSSTEAAVSHTPLLHISPIPGCESENVRFFAESGMSICVSDLERELLQSVRKLESGEIKEGMKQAQGKTVDPFPRSLSGLRRGLASFYAAGMAVSFLN